MLVDLDTHQQANVQPLHLVLMLICGYMHSVEAQWCVRPEQHWLILNGGKWQDFGPGCDQVDGQRLQECELSLNWINSVSAG